jgi:hypothetical protein
MTPRLLAILTDPLEGREPIEEIRRAGNGAGDGPEVRLVVPAVPETRFRDLMGDVDEPAHHAEDVLASSLATLRREGISASGEIGDSDPVLAAQDALRKAPADEVLIFEHGGDATPWFQDGLFERAQEELEPPLRMVVFEHEADGDHVVDVERASRGTVRHEVEHEVGASYFPGLSRSDFAGITVGIVGTILAVVLAAVGAAEAHTVSGWHAAAVLIAIGVALLNMAHVVGLTLFESVGYRGGFSRFFHTLSLVVTPAAVLANLLILLLA